MPKQEQEVRNVSQALDDIEQEVSERLKEALAVGPITFKRVIEKLVDMEFEFEVNHSWCLIETDPMKKYMPNDGRDVRYLYVQIGNMEYVIYDDDEETLTQIYETLLYW